MEKQVNTTKKPLPRYAYLVLVGVALGMAYVAIARAIDTGGTLDYVAALVFFGLAIRNLTLAFGRKKER